MESKKKQVKKEKAKNNALYEDTHSTEDWNLVALNSEATTFRDKETGAIFSLEQEQKAGGKMFLKQLNKGKLVVD